jgi:hypothetical protein
LGFFGLSESFFFLKLIVVGEEEVLEAELEELNGLHHSWVFGVGNI